MLFSAVAASPVLGGAEDGEGCRVEIRLGGAAGDRDRGVAAPNVIGSFPPSEGKRP